MQKTAFSFGRLATISLFTLSCVGLLIFLWLAFGGSVPLQPKGYRAQISFTDATQLADQADVRVAGVTIGKVVGKKLDPAGNRTIATIEIEPKYAPLRTGARAILRLKTLLGETYVGMTFGPKTAPAIPEGGRLADAQVRPAVDFDEFLQTFDKPTRKIFQQWQASLAKATAGREQDISNTLGNLPEFIGNAQSVVDVLDRRRQTLGALVRETGSTFEAVTRNESGLQNLITDNAATFRTLSDKRERIAETILAFPTFLRESRATLKRLSKFSNDTTPLVRDLKPVLVDVQPTLASLRTLSPDLQALFMNLRPLIVAGRTGLPALSRVLQGVDPALAAQGPLLQQLNPILQYLETQQTTISDFITQGGAATSLKVPVQPGVGTTGHALPQLIMAGTQTLPADNRTADNRGNSYYRGGDLALPTLKDPKVFSLPSFDCNNVGGPKPPTDTPGCILSQPFDFQGKISKYPQIGANKPGGVSQTP